jgi:hypothetical protein
MQSSLAPLGGNGLFGNGESGGAVNGIPVTEIASILSTPSAQARLKS